MADRRLILILCVLAASVAGCEGRVDGRRLSVHLVDHFKKNGLEGRYRRTNPEVIGAIESGRYTSRDFDLEFARFDDPAKARALKKHGFNGERVYTNGVYIMLVRRADTKINPVTVFKKF
ncbi:MAG: hypothetical protein Tsb009_01150 [Planctomycetaceae bacterium]